MVLIGVVVILAVGGYFTWSNKSNNLNILSAPNLSYAGGEKPYVQITWDYSVADYFNIYRSTDQNNWQIIFEKYPQNAHASVDYDFPKDSNVLYYKIISIDKNGVESIFSTVASVTINK